MCVSNFSAHMSEIFFILRRNERVVFGNVHRSSCTVPLFFSDFNETLIFSTDFEKSSNTKFHENPPSGSRAVPCGRIDGRTDGYDEASSCPSQFCESAKNDTKTLKYKGYINTVWSQVLVWEIEETEETKDFTYPLCPLQSTRMSKSFWTNLSTGINSIITIFRQLLPEVNAITKPRQWNSVPDDVNTSVWLPTLLRPLLPPSSRHKSLLHKR